MQICPFSYHRCETTCPYTFDDCEGCAQCGMLNETAPGELIEISDKLRNIGFFIIRKDMSKIYQLQDKTIKGYTCSQLCDYLEKEQGFDKEDLEMIERVDNSLFIASYLPILY